MRRCQAAGCSRQLIAVRVEDAVDVDAVTSALEALAAEIQVDVTLES